MTEAEFQQRLVDIADRVAKTWEECARERVAIEHARVDGLTSAAAERNVALNAMLRTALAFLQKGGIVP